MCFSNHYESFNPIIKCIQCKSRFHSHCVSESENNKTKDKCDKCKYKKSTAIFKQNTPMCFICNNEFSSVMVTKLSQNKYAHSFCLLTNPYYEWTIYRGKIQL